MTDDPDPSGLPESMDDSSGEGIEPPEADAPSRIGPYWILDVLGQGGMGTVYLAEQREPVRRRVALKLIKLGMDTRSVLTRFEAERQALAIMEHDNIAKVFDAGATDKGRPYFVMEYIKGSPIQKYCDAQRLSIPGRLMLLQEVCAGVQHAHQKGVIHRDLKPSNILITVQGGKPVPKIIDFGLARATDHRLVEATMFTEKGQIVGTPEYMSPEQAGLDELDIDTRTDVYSLGVVLYELLVGELPFPGRELRSAGILELQRKIREEDPPKPSTRLSGFGDGSKHAATGRRTDPRGLLSRVRGDLDWITMKALEKDRTRRYQSVAALGDDLRRHLDDDPVEAGPPGTWYRLKKQLIKHRLQATAALAVFLALLIGLIVSTLSVREARAAQKKEAKALEEFDLLYNVILLRNAKAALSPESKYFPAWPDNAPAIRTWLREHGEPMERKLWLVENALSSLKGRAKPPAANHEAGGAEPGTHRYSKPRDQYLHDSLTVLLKDLRQFTAPRAGAVSLMRERLNWVETVQRRTIEDHRAKWDEAIAAIKEKHGLHLEPQVGLVPLREDPKSGLWEFLVLRSGAPPETASKAGGCKITSASGIVLVLVPVGNYWRGAQSKEEGDAYDIHALDDETPSYENVPAFFVSKYEMSQGQWLRLAGANPSIYQQELRDTLVHPVQQVSRRDCVRILRRAGLRLPSETEWEYACRAGTTAPWWTGAGKKDLEGACNLADQAARRRYPSITWEGIRDWPELDDGAPLTAPVDSYRANRFGLHNVHGNVAEWCADSMQGLPVSRGGSFQDKATDARSARRIAQYDQPQGNVGVRPARSVLSR